MPQPTTSALTPATWARVSTLFDSARELPAGARGPWLARLAQDQPELAPWLHQMLAAHLAARTDDWLERGPVLNVDGHQADGNQAGDLGLQAGSRLGPWVLHERLGQGGMATVWRATRADALPAREVALKLPLSSVAGTRSTERLTERFTREQNILARLAHPHIARLYDAGVAADGTPWLAMECVHGQAIDSWCDQHRLGLRERLALFSQVLQAVHYAHARLVIHRDLKPSNIFVTEEGQVQLLDFGIAKLLAADEQADASALTQAHQRAMTPAYAAPEQVQGLALTTAVDVYALGVVLFKLLVGRSPYRLKIDTPLLLEQAVASADVQRASATVRDADNGHHLAARGCSARALRRALVSDLDTLLAKAMAQDPGRRYASAAAFADDITRYLAGAPLAAQPDAALYRLQKYLARHRLQAAAIGAVALSLTLGLGLALWQASLARHERNAARAEAERSVAINFFFSDLLEDASRSDQPVTGSQLVARTEALARREFNASPDALAAVLLSIGMLHNGQGRPAESLRVLEEAHALARDPALRNDVACDLAALLDDKQRALTLLQGVADQPSTSARSRAACLVYLGDLQRASDAPLAEQRYRQALAEWQKSPSHSPHDHVTILGRLAFVAALQGHTAAALAGYEQALSMSGSVGRDASAMGEALRNRQGRTLLIAGAPARALVVFDEILAQRYQAQRSALLPADVLINKGQALLDLGRADQAGETLQAAAESASAAGHRVRFEQAACLMRWAAAVVAAADTGMAPTTSTSTSTSTTTTTTTTATATAPPASISAANDDALTRTLCAMTQAQVSFAQRQWPAVISQIDLLLAQPLPEPQWAVDALLLRARARLQLGQRAAAASDTQRALVDAQGLQDGATASLRTQTVLAGLAALAASAAQTVQTPAARGSR
jgi:eukaryotic-like serine/threonine-protein kinase